MYKQIDEMRRECITKYVIKLLEKKPKRKPQ